MATVIAAVFIIIDCGFIKHSTRSDFSEGVVIAIFIINIFLYGNKIAVKMNQTEKSVREEIAKETSLKPKTYPIVSKVILVNNKTDKQYEIESVNEFSLLWKWSDAKDSLVLYHGYSFEPDDDDGRINKNRIGIFKDFSILEITHKEVIVPPPTETIK